MNDFIEYGEWQMELLNLTRPVDLLVIHCTATPPEMDIGVKEIRKWHMDKGWSDVGYHWVIRRDGTIEDGRPVNLIGAHTRGYNKKSLGLAMVGGVDENMRPEANFTGKQWHSLGLMCRGTRAVLPKIAIQGHNEFDFGKACPSFPVQNWLQSENI